MSDPADFIGRGLAWPLGVDQSGSLETSSGADAISSSLHMVLDTAPGERLMRPLFGCRIWNLLFEPINANTLGMMSEAVYEAIGRWEPRVELEDVRVTADERTQGRVLIHIDYLIKTTNDRRNLVYPFYVIPRESES